MRQERRQRLDTSNRQPARPVNGRPRHSARPAGCAVGPGRRGTAPGDQTSIDIRTSENCGALDAALFAGSRPIYPEKWLKIVNGTASLGPSQGWTGRCNVVASGEDCQM